MATQNPDIAIESVTILRNEVPSPTGQDGKVLGVQSDELAWVDPAVDSNDKVRATSADTTPDYLGSKLVAGDNVSLSVQDPGGNEKVKVDVAIPPSVDEKTKVSATDTTPDYLGSKLIEGDNVTLTVEGSGADEKIKIAASGGSATDEKVKTSELDALAGPLAAKLYGGDNVSLSEVDTGGGILALRIDANVPSVADEKVKISGSDDDAGYLADKLQPGSGISMDIEGEAGEEQLIRIGLVTNQSPLILAVSTIGSDAPTADRPATLYGGDYSDYPFATIQAAIDAVGLVRGPKTTINVGAGTFAPFDLTGKSTDTELWIIGTFGTAVGPFTVTARPEQYWAFQVSGAGWTPNAFAGMQIEVLSGAGAGGKGTVYSNTADTINVCGAMSMDTGSVFRILPYATVIQGIGDEYQATVNLHSLKGRFVLKALDCISTGDQEANINIANCNGARVGLYQVRADGIGNGIQADGVGALLLMLSWFNGDYDSAMLYHVLSTYVEPETEEDWFAPYSWYSVGFPYDVDIKYCGALTYLRGRFSYGFINGASYVNTTEIKIDDGGIFGFKFCPSIYQQGLGHKLDVGGYIDYQDCGNIQIISGTPRVLQFNRCGFVFVGALTVGSLSFQHIGEAQLSNPTIRSGTITARQGFLNGTFKYSSAGNVYDGSVFHPFTDFNPGPTSYYKTDQNLTITLQGSAA